MNLKKIDLYTLLIFMSVVFLIMFFISIGYFVFMWIEPSSSVELFKHKIDLSKSEFTIHVIWCFYVGILVVSFLCIIISWIKIFHPKKKDKEKSKT